MTYDTKVRNSTSIHFVAEHSSLQNMVRAHAEEICGIRLCEGHASPVKEVSLLSLR